MNKELIAFIVSASITCIVFNGGRLLYARWKYQKGMKRIKGND